MKDLFISLIVQPFYNTLILLVDFLTTDLGIAIIILTIIIRTILFPLSKSQIRTQIKMQQVQGPLKEIQKKYKDDREAMGREMLKLYKEHKLNPFSGIFLIMIQLPLLIGLYYVFMNSGLPELNTNLLYSFVPRPEYINTNFLGMIEMTQKSLLLAILAMITQFIQMKIILPKNISSSKNVSSGEINMEDMMKNMQKQMLYIMPIILFFVSYTFGAIIGLYILVGNIYSIGQELYIRKTIKRD
ncbi:MAG TPA: YidC/Oxa1 family membrane protein insertase [Candidatus Paceibacterota bacterium]|nr:YidC/Oxa1 family membrane protein insertase [Candidatus Paceibacterota bacterium]HMP18991.1 YidC/Oxa1 family membrane protein insertase [Candidatus Paceibacterota bacterium]HMP85234.1 YidC/Oxa1 family membrane protein insertase [Candidatus Paceibacterota bacterium]